MTGTIGNTSSFPAVPSALEPLATKFGDGGGSLWHLSIHVLEPKGLSVRIRSFLEADQILVHTCKQRPQLLPPSG